MIKVDINLDDNNNKENRSYPIYIATGFNELSKVIKGDKLSNILIITDSNVEKYYAKDVLEIFKNQNSNVYMYSIAAGEKSKNLDTVKDIYKFLIENKFDRNSTLIALGGGVVGDITGFVAATFLRGITFVQIPTSLIAQADSSIGGKTGVDFDGKKNIIGCFYQPKFVYININTLKTLPKREFISGLAEVIKYGVILDQEFFDYVEYNINKILNYDENVLQYIAKANCIIKGKIVEQDEKDNDLRAILNFGHTIGHAIESQTEFNLLHGECVSIGMIGALKVSRNLGFISDEVVNKVMDVFDKLSLPTKLQDGDADKIVDYILYDKKYRGGKLLFVLPVGIGIGEVKLHWIEDMDAIKKVVSELVE